MRQISLDFESKQKRRIGRQPISTGDDATRRHREAARHRARKRYAAELGISLEEYESRLRLKSAGLLPQIGSPSAGIIVDLKDDGSSRFNSLMRLRLKQARRRGLSLEAYTARLRIKAFRIARSRSLQAERRRERKARAEARAMPKEKLRHESYASSTWNQCFARATKRAISLSSNVELEAKDPWRRFIKNKWKGAWRKAGVSIKFSDLRALLESQAYRCALTGDALSPETAELEHKLPRKRGGTDELDNLQFVVKTANTAKHTMTNEEFIDLCRKVVRLHGLEDEPSGEQEAP